MSSPQRPNIAFAFWTARQALLHSWRSPQNIYEVTQSDFFWHLLVRTLSIGHNLTVDELCAKKLLQISWQSDGMMERKGHLSLS